MSPPFGAVTERRALLHGLTLRGPLPTFGRLMYRTRLIAGLIAALFTAGSAPGSLRAQEPATTGAYNDEAAGYFQQAQ